MSLGGFFNELHPLFRLVEEPRSSYNSPARSSDQQRRRQAVVELSEEEKEYAVRAEVPGVQKKDVDINIGDDGHSLTIEGHVHRTDKSTEDTSKSAEKSGEKSEETYDYRYTFSRTVWFPHAVDGGKAQAKLTDGILTINIPKRVEPGRQRINLQ